GERVTELMKQAQYAPLSIAEMAVSIFAAEEGYLDALPVAKVLPFEKSLHAFMHANHGTLMAEIVKTGKWDDGTKATFKAALEEFKKTGSW
ncbi:MAG TPA: F0F1 ATP synthase subunit alpha, partial [Rhodanobacteraceae bacterium]